VGKTATHIVESKSLAKPKKPEIYLKGRFKAENFKLIQKCAEE
jgi:hypothetical protein